MVYLLFESRENVLILITYYSHYNKYVICVSRGCTDGEVGGVYDNFLDFIDVSRFESSFCGMTFVFVEFNYVSECQVAICS